DSVHTVTSAYIRELRQLDCKSLRYPQNFRVMVQTGDETLDYRLAAEKFSKAELVIRQVGSHSYDGYAGELPAIEAFLLSRIAESVR
ncbi:MAG: YqiA/YcfP family alpha/beta fold hydrolase, partial [Pseudomonadota bacterium]|nr:YqiA/YcfP family alpha/beta fold hydrolase [Pseudomonadota bacterium]